jgi:hypothetical protein
VDAGSNPFHDWESPREASQPHADDTTAVLDGPLVRRRPSRLTVLVLVALVAAVPAVLLNVSRGSGSSTPVASPAFLQLSPSPVPGVRLFTTAIPRSWYVSMTFPDAGVTDYQVASSSPGVPPSDVLPPAGMIEIQIEDFQPAFVAAVLGHRAARESARQLLGLSSVPKGAKHIARSRARTLMLDRLSAAEETYTYLYGGQRDIQTELVARHAGEIVSNEMDEEPALRASATKALDAITARWRWLTPATAIRTVPHTTRPLHVPPTGPLPAGQWIAAGFTDAVTGDVADAKLDQSEIRAWDFSRLCLMPGSCHAELVDQLESGGTTQAQVVRIPGNFWWRATFPVIHTLCARRRSRPTLKETISDTIDLGWASQAHRELLANETQTILGCGTPIPATVAYHWTARPVPPPSSIPRLSVNPRHTSSAIGFRKAAGRVCTRTGARAAQVVGTIARALRVFRKPTSSTASAAAELTVARHLAPLLALSAEQYTLIPQPPAGPLDALWLRDIAANRAQLASGAAASAALEAAATATTRYLHGGTQLQLQTALTEGTLFSQDLSQIVGPAVSSTAIAQTLGLPADCTNAPGIYSVFSTPAVR